MRNRKIKTALAILMLIATGVAQMFAQEMIDVSARRAIADIREIRIAVPAREIEVVPGSEAAIVVSGSMPASTSAAWSENGGKTWISSPARGAYVIELTDYNPGRVRGRLQIAVPPVSRLVISAGAAVTVSSEVEELVSNAYGGTLKVERAADVRHIEIDSFGGVIDLRTPALRTARINSIESTVALTAREPEFLDITTMSGNLNIHVDNLIAGVHRFATTSGSLVFHVDEEFNGRLTIQTVEGRIGPPNGGTMELGGRAMFEFIYGTGEARVNLRSLSGDITTRVTTGQEFTLPHETQ